MQDQDVSALLKHSFLGHVVDVQELLNKGVDPNATDTDGRTALHRAAMKGRVEVMHQLISHGALPSCSSKFGTPLHLAASAGHAEAVAALLGAGANPDERDQNGATALHLACSQGQALVVRTLLGAGAAPDLPGQAGYTPLHEASANGLVEVARMLVQAGAHLDAGDAHGQSALHLAAANGHVDTVRFLMLEGADAWLWDSRDCTASDLAAANRHDGVVEAIQLCLCNMDVGSEGVDEQGISEDNDADSNTDWECDDEPTLDSQLAPGHYCVSITPAADQYVPAELAGAPQQRTIECGYPAASTGHQALTRQQNRKEVLHVEGKEAATGAGAPGGKLESERAEAAGAGAAAAAKKEALEHRDVCSPSQASVELWCGSCPSVEAQAEEEEVSTGVETGGDEAEEEQEEEEEHEEEDQEDEVFYQLMQGLTSSAPTAVPVAASLTTAASTLASAAASAHTEGWPHSWHYYGGNPYTAEPGSQAPGSQLWPLGYDPYHYGAFMAHPDSTPEYPYYYYYYPSGGLMPAAAAGAVGDAGLQAVVAQAAQGLQQAAAQAQQALQQQSTALVASEQRCAELQQQVHLLAGEPEVLESLEVSQLEELQHRLQQAQERVRQALELRGSAGNAQQQGLSGPREMKEHTTSPPVSVGCSPTDATAASAASTATATTATATTITTATATASTGSGTSFSAPDAPVSLHATAAAPPSSAPPVPAASTQAPRCCKVCGEPSAKVCRGCAVARYCSVNCQEADWKQHRKQCAGAVPARAPVQCAAPVEATDT